MLDGRSAELVVDNGQLTIFSSPRGDGLSCISSSCSDASRLR